MITTRIKKNLFLIHGSKTEEKLNGITNDFFLLGILVNFVLMMDDELMNRFFQKKLQELLHDNTKPFPTIICERERLEIIELVRRFCLYSTKMIPFSVKHSLSLVSERLELKKVEDYGDLYIDVNIN
jgi:hypothetical protein